MTYAAVIQNLKFYGNSLMNSYSQVFFSDNRIFSLLILVSTFLVPASGIAGLSAVAISTLLAVWLGYDKGMISKGIFGYNSLLVALPLGLWFRPGAELVMLVVLASILTFFFTVALRGWMSKSGLPFLSWPFVLTTWVVMFAINHLTAVEVGDQSLFVWNRLYETGGINLVRAVEWFSRIPIPEVWRSYLFSLGAVFFQSSLFAGFLVAIGLLIGSRISFLLSLTGFFSAWLFYQVIGLDLNTLSYSYVGFNYILMAIALGGFFLIPTLSTFLWVVVLVPVTTLVTVSFAEILEPFGVAIYALPFNLVVPLFLLVLRQRLSVPTGLHPVVVQHNSPEKNLYAWSNYRNRFGRHSGILLKLPFLGQWTVSQGHDGKLTHQSHWRYAWDFVRTGPDGKTWTGDGTSLSDFLCYGVPVFASVSGIIESVVDGIPDNKPGGVNTMQNWGNSIVVRHSPSFFTKYSHLKEGTIRVKPGDLVTPDTELAKVGSSGRSPEPHLHFQVQTEPGLDAGTIACPFGYYIHHDSGKKRLKSFEIPGEGDILSNPVPEQLPEKVLRFIPGQRLQVSGNCNGQSVAMEWEVHTDWFNNSYLYSRTTGSIAWFTHDGQSFCFTHYDGSRKDPLYVFFLSCFRVPFVFDPDILTEDEIPLYSAIQPVVRWFHDWIAPFVMVLRSTFTAQTVSLDDPLNPEIMRINTRVSHSFEIFRYHRTFKTTGFSVSLNDCGSIHIGSGTTHTSIEIITGKRNTGDK